MPPLVRYSHREGVLGEMRDMVVPPPEEHEALSTESPVETGMVVPQHRKTRRRIVVASGVLAGNGVSISITPLGRRPAFSSPSLLGHRRNGNHTLEEEPKDRQGPRGGSCAELRGQQGPAR